MITLTLNTEQFAHLLDAIDAQITTARDELQQFHSLYDHERTDANARARRYLALWNHITGDDYDKIEDDH